MLQVGWAKYYIFLTLCHVATDYCDASNSLPALLVTRTSEYRNNGPALADDGWWFHFLEDKIAAYILSATENAPTPEILCCVTTVGQLDTCLQDDVNSNAIVIKVRISECVINWGML